MRVGDLRVPFTLQAEDATGAWNNITSLWGSLDVTYGENVSHETYVRANEDVITTGMRLAYDGRYFLVVDMEKYQEKERWIKLSLTEILTLN